MEAQTYLTQIPNNKQNQSSLPTKFIRLNQTQGKRAKTQLNSFKKQNHHILTSLNKNINQMLPEQYYAVKKIKPGIGFYKIILQGEEKRKVDPNIPFLNINLPKTLLFNQNSLDLLYSQNGIVKIKSQINFNQFRKILNISEYSEYKQVQLRQIQNKQIYSAALTGIGVGIFSDFSVSLSNQIDLRVLPRNQNQFSIKFIQPYADIPNMLRLFYIPKNIKNSKPNYAFKAINKKKLSQQISQKKHKLIYNYLVDFNKQNLIITTLVKGKALNQVQQMTQSIINYLQAIKRVKITEIVIDFIFGQDKLYYFHQLKSVKSLNQKNAWHIGDDPTQFSLQYKQQTNQILCKLCGYFYPKIQISKSITNKLILQLLTHLRNRGQRLLQNCSNILKCNNINLSGISNVCDLCYQLIVAQHKLIDVQRSFLDIVNMGVDQIVRVKQIQNIKICQQQQLGDMIQWRLFLYIEKVKNLPMSTVRQQEYVLNMKFNDIKETFTKKYKGLPFFNPSRLNSATTTKSSFMGKSFIKSNHSRMEKKSTLHTTFTNRSNFLSPKQISEINFQKIKLITFYTKTTDISQILQNQQIIFELSFNGQKFKGCSSTLKNFGNRKQCQRHTFQVLLFDNLYKYYNLEVSVGLICDNQVSMRGLQVRQSSNGRLWYLQKNGGTGCSPLPAEWMQIITQGLIPQQYSPIKANKQNQQQDFEYHEIYKNQCKSVPRKYQNLNKSQQILQQNISELKNMRKLDQIGFSSFF